MQLRAFSGTPAENMRTGIQPRMAGFEASAQRADYRPAGKPWTIEAGVLRCSRPGKSATFSRFLHH